MAYQRSASSRCITYTLLCSWKQFGLATVVKQQSNADRTYNRR